MNAETRPRQPREECEPRQPRRPREGCEPRQPREECEPRQPRQPREAREAREECEAREHRLSDAQIDALGDDIAVLAAHIDAATQQLLTQIREFDNAGGWFRQGAISCAQWLSWRIGMGAGAAREKLRVAHKLAELPLIDKAFAAGMLSYSKVRAMTRVATADNEATLLEMAPQMTAAQLEKTCRLLRGVKRLDEAAPSFESCERYVRSRDTDDQMVSIHIKLLPEEAARLLKAIEACADGGNRADGVVHMAEAALLGERGAGTSAVAAGDADAAGVARVRPPVEAVVHISADSLAGHTEQGDGVSAETSRRLLCDCGVVPMLEDGAGATIDVGRKTRTIPSAIRRALAVRDDGCRFPGCDNRRFLDAHHIEHWLEGGATRLDNLTSLCRRHHRFVHEWGYTIERRGQETVFVDPNGKAVERQGWRPAAGSPMPWLSERVRARAITIDPSTNECAWDGWPIRYDLCVEALVDPG